MMIAIKNIQFLSKEPFSNCLCEVICTKLTPLEFTERITLLKVSLLEKPKEMESQWRRFSSVQSLSHVWLFVTPWTAAFQASLSITNSQSLPKLMSIELVMPFSHLILCHPLLLSPSIFPSIRVFSNELALLRVECYFQGVWNTLGMNKTS